MTHEYGWTFRYLRVCVSVYGVYSPLLHSAQSQSQPLATTQHITVLWGMKSCTVFRVYPWNGFTMRKGKSPVRFISIRHYLSPSCICCHSQYVRSVYNTHTQSQPICCGVVKHTSRRHTNSSLIFWMVEIWVEREIVWFFHAHAHHTKQTCTLIHSYNVVWLNICVSYGRERELNHMHTAVWWITTNQNSRIYTWTWKFECEHWTVNTMLAGAKSRNAFSEHETLSIWMGFSFCFFRQK